MRSNNLSYHLIKSKVGRKLMTVYNINLGIGWASSGVEYAQAYRAKAFRTMKIPAKFIFSDLILANNIEDLTKNIGFTDDQIIWLYNFFTDVKIAPSDYPLDQLVNDLNLQNREHKKIISDNGKECQYILAQENLIIVVRMHDKDKETIDQVSYVYNQQMVKRDFYSYVKYASEYYAGTAKDNHVTYREFFNEDGSLAYTQYLDNGKEMYEFPNQRMYYSKNALYAEMIKELKLQDDDFVILDRMDEDKQLNNGQIIFENYHPAKLIVVVHADHYDPHFTSKQNILWNNFYEYQFTHTDNVASYIVATEKQKELLAKQQKHYRHANPRIDVIPVGSLPQLTVPKKERKPHSIITASRLAVEKHVDWLVKAVIEAHKKINDISLDIYGQGAERSRLEQLIKANHAETYIHLMGQRNLNDIYPKYSAYVAASTSEGFGLSLLEAVGAGLPMIGFDVPYGNQTFIEDGKNGYLLPYNEEWADQRKYESLSKAIVKLFSDDGKLTKFSNHSYKLAKPYLTENVAKSWKKVLEELSND